MQALVAMLMMIAVYASAISFGRAYDAKVVSGQHARALAWASGTTGCPGGGRASSIADDSRSVASNVEAAASGDVLDTVAALFFSLSPRTTEEARREARAPVLAGRGQVAFQTSTQFACNEEPDLNGDIWSIAGWAVDLFSDLI